MNVVIDTNVFVSAFLTPGRNASKIVTAVFSGLLKVCYDHRIIDEYSRVFHYPKLHIEDWEVSLMLGQIIGDGISVVPDPVTDIPFDRDETDRKFYEVARFCQAILITGNLKHYPEDPCVMSMSEFIDRHLTKLGS